MSNFSEKFQAIHASVEAGTTINRVSQMLLSQMQLNMPAPIKVNGSVAALVTVEAWAKSVELKVEKLSENLLQISF